MEKDRRKDFDGEGRNYCSWWSGASIPVDWAEKEFGWGLGKLEVVVGETWVRRFGLVGREDVESAGGLEAIHGSVRALSRGGRRRAKGGRRGARVGESSGRLGIETRTAWASSGVVQHGTAASRCSPRVERA